MKMSIIEFQYTNIRKISSLKISFLNKEDKVIKNNFVMMANGTGKTTTMALIKGLLDGTAAEWSSAEVKSYSPTLTSADS